MGHLTWVACSGVARVFTHAVLLLGVGGMQARVNRALVAQ